MEERLIESKAQYESSDVNDKLWGSFFRIVIDYKEDMSNSDIMSKCFKVGDEIKSHRKTNANIKLI